MTLQRRFCLLLFLFACSASDRTFGQLTFEREPIKYSRNKPTDAIAKLSAELAAGEKKLTWEDDHGYLKSLLNQLKIPPSSQTLVFSKTSFQRSRISPRTPRALYFNDDVYIGWVLGGDFIEVSTADPNLGAVFYSLDQENAGARPTFLRETDKCLSCHASTHTRRIPGHIMRSVFPEASGQPRFSAGTFRTNHSSPFRERYGGWYVTGTHGEQRHLGNQTHTEDDDGLDPELGANITSLNTKITIDRYLTPHSDLVALMVLAHQVQVHNAITTANFNARRAAHDAVIMNKALGRDVDFESDSTKRRYASAAGDLVEALLFVDEAELTAPVAGTSTFAAEFEKLGPGDARGRSLREFDLKTRMFRYPCSFLIYSDAFEALSNRLKTDVWQQLNAVLAGDGDPEKFGHLSQADRTAIAEILDDTLPRD